METRRDRLVEALERRCRSEKIEPPTVGQIGRVVASAVHSHEEMFAAETVSRMGADVCDRLAGLLSRDGLLAELRADPGALDLETLFAEIDKLAIVAVLGLPDDLIEKPWAFDKDGTAVETTYTTDASVLTLHVEHQGAAYPVVADPRVDWDLISGTAYFNKTETAEIAFVGRVAIQIIIGYQGVVWLRQTKSQRAIRTGLVVAAVMTTFSVIVNIVDGTYFLLLTLPLRVIVSVIVPAWAYDAWLSRSRHSPKALVNL